LLFSAEANCCEKINEIGMTEDYDKNYSLRLALRCLPALSQGGSREGMQL